MAAERSKREAKSLASLRKVCRCIFLCLLFFLVSVARLSSLSFSFFVWVAQHQVAIEEEGGGGGGV